MKRGRRHTGPRWYASKQCFFVSVGGKLINLGPDHSQAQAKYAEIMVARQALVDGDRASVISILDLWLQEIKRTRKPNTYKLWQRVLQAFCDKYGKLQVCDLRPADVLAFLTDMSQLRQHPSQHGRSHHWGNGTGRIFVSALKAAFRWAVDQGLIGRNPVASLRRPPSGVRDVGCVVTEVQHRLLLSQAPPALRDVLLALYETGARPGAVISVEASEVQGDQWVLGDKPGRKLRKLVVYLTPAVQQLCARREGLLFRNEYGQPWTTAALQAAIKALRRRCGLPHVTAYGYRHSFAYRALQGGGNVAHLAALMGTSVAQIEKTYGHLTSQADTLRRALASMRA